MSSVREKRKEEIRKAVAFIESPLAFPDPEGYQGYLTQLVCNLLEEGNACSRDGQWEHAIREFSEGLNVSSYAKGEDISIPPALLESLYVNRAAAYQSMGKYDQGVEDCNSALAVCLESRRALYRKALCLKELGKYRDAYNCTSSCLLSNPQDKQVNELAQELAVHLGLKIRKPYVSSKACGSSLQNGVNPQCDVAPESLASVPTFPVSSVLTVPGSAPPGRREAVEDSELIGEDLDSLLDCIPAEEGPAQVGFSIPSRMTTSPHAAPPALPAPTPRLPPAFFSSAINSFPSSSSAAKLDLLDDLSPFGTGGGAEAPNIVQTSTALSALDGLDSLDTLDAFVDVKPGAAAEPKKEPDMGDKSLDKLLDEADTLGLVSDPSGLNGVVPKISAKATEKLDCLDALDSFPTVGGVTAALPAVSIGGKGLDTLSDFHSNGFSDSHAAAPVIQSPKNRYKEKDSPGPAVLPNPLSSTHEFLPACSTCFPQEGQGIYSFVHKPDLAHSCKQDILLCRRKKGFPLEWTRVRRLPTWTSFSGPFVLCKELLRSGNLGICKYGEKCSFAYNQLEIDVWTEERKGTLDRNLLFETPFVKLDPVNSIIGLLQEDKGMFIFLCQECYDSKPRIISKRSSFSHSICSNLDARHNFDANKCLAFVVRTHIVKYNKVRPYRSFLCWLDLCNYAIRYGCQKEDDCRFAHSVIELKTWRVQQHTGISPDEIVKISMTYYEKQEQNPNKEKVNRLSFGAGGSKSKLEGGFGKTLNMKMKFACAQCWRDGLISEPDKALKYCSAKARHMWTKDRRVLLVKSPERSKWVQVRPLPHAKNFPLQYDMCAQILEKRKCNYHGNCTFAHSPEEKEMWMYMKNNELIDMQQMYDMWLALAAHSRQAEGATNSQPYPEGKSIPMPTDYAEPMNGFHCRLCGKHSNSERQWQQHISSEKHKDRVFSCEGEDEALTWNYRFPGTCFKLCPRLDGRCPDGVSCDYAHSPEELLEWTERRGFLRQKLAKAREDMLIMPDDFDFGKYNFLMKD
ncbi:zinc finger CCCH domain-containing protein 7B-like isoform 1-T2 [Menidia menidia]